MTKVAVAQFAMQAKIPNIDRVAAMSAEAAALGAKLVVFPELCLPGYDLPLLATQKRNIEKESIESLQTIALKYELAIFAGLATEKENIAVLVGRDGLLTRYSKTHLFDFKKARESDLFERGNGPISPTPWNNFQLAPLICFDLRFPELARSYAAKGANLFLTSSAWPYSRAEVFFTLARARAIENQAYLLSSNFVGTNSSGDRFAGSSAIFAPDGSVLTKLDTEEEGVLVADLDISFLETVRLELNCKAKQRSSEFYK